MSTVKEMEKPEAEAKPVSACAVQRAIATWTDFQEDKMCGKCHPCMLGSFEVLGILNRLSSGKGSEGDVNKLDLIVAEMLMGSRCKKGKDVAQTLVATLKDGRDELYEHFQSGTCRNKECKDLIAYRIDTAKCTMCGECLPACKYTAIAGEKREGFGLGYMPYRVRQARCVKCDECRVVCPEDAVEILTGRQILG